MLLQILRRALLAAAILPIAAVQASPFYDLETRNNIGLDARDVFVPPTTCDPLVVGATAATMGQVCVGISSGTLTVVYTVNPGWTINKVHVLVTTATPTSSQNVPGQFPYSSDKGTPPACTVSGDQKTATCSIPVQSSWRGCGQTLYIVTHADVTASDATQQTAWGKGTCYDSKGNCAKYWTFTEQCVCTLEIDFFPITYTVRENPRTKSPATEQPANKRNRPPPWPQLQRLLPAHFWHLRRYVKALHLENPNEIYA